MNDEERIDKLLTYFNEKAPNLEDVESNLKRYEPDIMHKDPNAWFRIQERLIGEGLVDRWPQGIRINTKGMTIVKSGGYLAHWKKIEGDENRKTENEKYELRNNRWLYKTRWWPLILSALAFIVSVAALFLSSK